MFHKVEKDFIAQSGDPTGTGRGGSSLNGVLYGEQARFFDDEITPKLTHQKRGTLSMASSGKNMNASQFFVTLRDGIDFLDGQHTVFGTLAEGSDVLDKINNAVVDDAHKPIKNIRIRHTVVLVRVRSCFECFVHNISNVYTTCLQDDPFEDPSTFVAPDQSPVRVEDPFDEDFVDPEEAAAAGPRSDADIARSIEEKQAHTRAVMLEMIGDLPDADIRPPENVLFVCKLNPNTVDEDLELIFSQFGQVIKCEVC
jgi:peptidyl-prolyl cis-trans isomerase-like 4